MCTRNAHTTPISDTTPARGPWLTERETR
jgi:hypothetical protein